MRAKLKGLHSPDIDDLESWSPGDGPFGLHLDAMIGPSDSKGEESFGITVCTPEWFANEQMRGHPIRSGLHTLFVVKYDYRVLSDYIERAAQRAEGKDWHEIGEKLSSLGRWEFAEYTP